MTVTLTTVPCPQCGELAAPDDRFCRNCGRALHDEHDRPTEPTASPAPTTERRLVTVLFADLVGFTTRVEHADPEDVAAFLADYFERAHDVITRFGGLVEKYIGDAVMAVWGARSANEDDAERAVRAGLELQDALAKLAAEAGEPDIALRVGVLTGEAAVRQGGNETTGMIVGDLVNAASRLQDLAEPGTVYVGPTTYRAAANAIEFEPVGEHSVRGRDAPIATWRAIRVVAERGGRGRVEGIDPPFVGRITELQLLKDVLGAVIQTGRSRLVSIIGEAGIGKSALVWELRKYADGLATEIFWNRGRSLSYGSEGIVYRAISDLLRGRLGVAEDDGTDVVAAALEKTLDRFVADPGERARIRPWLGSLLGLGDSPEGDRSELDAAVRSFLAHMAGAGPTVLVFDDLHWGDTGLLEFVEQLPDWMPDSPVLVITVARPQLLDRRPTRASGRRGVISLRLGPIPDEFMQRLLEGIMGELDTNLKRDIVDRAAGVPLYAVELTRALVGAGETFEVEGRTASHTGLEEFGIPETLQLLIGSRIDRLPADEQMTLLDAAVLGHAFSLAGLAAATDRTEADLRRHLEALVDQELIEPIRDPRSPLRGGYRFVQKLVREVARNRLSREVRRGRHIAIAEFYGAREGPDSAAIAADHYLSALEVTRSDDAANELRLRASGVLLAALDRAAGLYAHEEVLSLGRRMLELELGLDIGTQARIKERMAVAASAQLQPEDAAALAREALDLSTRCGDASGVRRSAALLAFVLLEHIQIDPAIAVLTEQLEGIDDLTVDPELPKLAGLLARAQFLRGDHEDALITADRALVAGEELNLRGTVGDALVTIATVRGVTGRPIEARLMLESVIDFADRHELNAVALRAYLNLGAVIPPSELAGNPTKEAIELGRRLGNRNFVLLALGNLANALVFRAQWDELETVLTDPLWEASQGSLLYARRSIDAAANAIRHGVFEGGEIETLTHRPAGDSNTFREFGARANAALVRLLTGHTDAAIEWANETLARIDEIPWIDATARVMMLVGDPTAVVSLAERVHSRRQTNDDRLGPFLRAAARAHRGQPGGFDEALAQIARLDEDGFVVEQVVRLIGLGRVLDPASQERTAAMEAAGEIVAKHDLNGLAPFLD